MRRVRDMLVACLAVALAIRVLWWAIAPIVPVAIGTLTLVLIFGALYSRKSRW